MNHSDPHGRCSFFFSHPAVIDIKWVIFRAPAESYHTFILLQHDSSAVATGENYVMDLYHIMRNLI